MVMVGQLLKNRSLKTMFVPVCRLRATNASAGLQLMQVNRTTSDKGCCAKVATFCAKMLNKSSNSQRSVI
jgi:hypothetical protein